MAKQSRARQQGRIAAPDRPPRRQVYVAAAVLAALVLGAYSNSFSGPLLFDDDGAISENATIRRLWPPPITPPVDSTVGGRPVVNLTLAINYAAGGTDVRGYHAANVAIHLLAALLLFGVVRRTLLLPAMKARFGAASTVLAAAVAAVWAVHPLQTESVTYIAQRVESLMGMFYLLAIYCVIRGATAGRGRRWYVAAAAASLIGMGCKEVMATAPVVILLYDRVFLAGSFREIFRRRRGLYAALAAGWILLAILILSSASRGNTVGFILGATPFNYALLQCVAIFRYLRLFIWPSGLCIDYGAFIAPDWVQAAPAMAGVLVGLAMTVLAWRRRGVLAFCGTAFFLILAPSSSFVPIVTQGMAEHRMYLPLAILSSLCVIGAFLAFDRVTSSRRTRTFASAAALAAVIACLAWATVSRNDDYRSGVSIWERAAAASPDNARAQNNLGNCLIAAGRYQEAIGPLQKAQALKGDYVEAYENLGIAYGHLDLNRQAVEQFEHALRLNPEFAAAWYNMASALYAEGRRAEAMEAYRRAVAIRDDFAEAHNGYGMMLEELGQGEMAMQQYRRAIEIRHDYPVAHYNMGNAFLHQGKLPQAIECYREAMRLEPGFRECRHNLQAAMQLLAASRPAGQ